MTWVKIIEGDDLWKVKKRPMAIEGFSTALYMDEKEHANAYKNSDGVDWDGYYKAKCEAGFSSPKKWNFFDSREVFLQTDSKWLKPRMGLTEDNVTWSIRANGLELHGSTVDVQIFAGAKAAIDMDSKRAVETHKVKHGEKMAAKWAKQLLDPYISVGHGVHFQTPIVVSKGFNLVNLLNKEMKFNIKNMTVLWTDHRFLFLILHEEDSFL